MSQPAHLRVIISEHDVQKLSLPCGIPGTVEELHSVVRETFGISGDFSLHYKDADFGNEFFSLLLTTDIKDKDTIKVVSVKDSSTVTFTISDIDSFQSIASVQPSDDASSSVSSQDTLPVSPGLMADSLAQRSKGWPRVFAIPRFSSSTEILLKAGNEKLSCSGTPFSTKDIISVLPDILAGLAEAIYEYTAYPSSEQVSQVAEALVKAHPCLKEPGSFNGCYGWIQRLKHKMNNFRTKLRVLGCPEIVVNSLKRKSAQNQAPSKNVKKPKRAEVNYLPPHPPGETNASLEKERVELLCEVKKKENGRVVNEKMAKTFSLRRQEIVDAPPVIRDFMDRWPALYDTTQINEEFKRITTIGLECTFMAKLDHCMTKLMDLVSSRGGAAGVRIRQIKNMLFEHNTVELRREVAIRCLVVYLGEKDVTLFKEFADKEQFEAALDRQVMTIAVIGDTPDDRMATIVIEGQKIVEGKDIPSCCALLMGLIYVLNMSYDKELKYTFEVFQKLFLELDGLKASAKIMSLKYSIF